MIIVDNTEIKYEGFNKIEKAKDDFGILGNCKNRFTISLNILTNGKLTKFAQKSIKEKIDKALKTIFDDNLLEE